MALPSRLARRRRWIVILKFILPAFLATCCVSQVSAATYWNLFNFEGEDELDSIFVTYNALTDMLNDSNRTGTFVADQTGDAARNIVGSGSDGLSYWNLFNFEGEDELDSIFVTYSALTDMLNDSNRTGTFVADQTGNAARNIVGTGAFAMREDPGDPVSPVPVPASMPLLAAAFGLLFLAQRGRLGRVMA